MPSAVLVASCTPGHSRERLSRETRRRAGLLREAGLLPEAFPISQDSGLPRALVATAQVGAFCRASYVRHATSWLQKSAQANALPTVQLLILNDHTDFDSVLQEANVDGAHAILDDWGEVESLPRKSVSGVFGGFEHLHL